MSILNLQAKSKLARLLARENILVVHKDTPTASFDTENRVLTLPNFSTNISVDLYDMFVGHEVSHALNTPNVQDGTSQAKIMDSLPKAYWNVVEDVRVDRLIKRQYPGLAKSYQNGCRDLWDSGFYGVSPSQVPDLCLIDRINLQYKVGIYGIANIPFNEDERQFLNRANEIRTFDEALALAQDIFEYEKEEQKKQQQQEQEQDSDCGSDDSDDNDQKGDNKSKGKGKNKDKKSDDKPESDDNNEGCDSSDGDEDQDDKGDQSGGSSASDSDEDDKEEDGKGGSDSSDSDDKEEDGDDQSDSGSDSKEEGDDQSDSADGGSDQSDDGKEKPSKQKPSSGKEKQSQKKPSKQQIEKAAAKAAEEVAGKVSSLGNYQEYLSRNQDKNQYLAMPRLKLNNVCHVTNEAYMKGALAEKDVVDNQRAEEWLAEIQKDNKPFVNAMVKKFEMHKSAEARRKAAVSKTGQLDMNRLHQYQTHDDIFRRTTVLAEGKSHGLFILMDLSSSMNGNMKDFIRRLDIVLSFADRVGIPYEVWAFANHSYYGWQFEESAINKHCDTLLPTTEFTLVNVLSNVGKRRQAVRKNKVAFLANILFSRHFECKNNKGRVGKVSTIGNTPLVSSMISLPPFINEFNRKTGVELTSLFVVTDGSDNKGFSDHRWGNIIGIDFGRSYEIGSPMDFKTLDTLADWLKFRCNLHSATGFYIKGEHTVTGSDKNHGIKSVKSECKGFDDYFYTNPYSNTKAVNAVRDRMARARKQGDTVSKSDLIKYQTEVRNGQKSVRLMAESFAKVIA